MDNEISGARQRIVAELTRVELARQMFNQVYPEHAIPLPGVLSPDPVPVPERPAVLSIREDGTCVLRDHLDFIEKCEAGEVGKSRFSDMDDSSWFKRWAKEDGRPRLNVYMFEVAKYTGVSEYQANQIINNCSRATHLTLSFGRPIDPETGALVDDRTMATFPFAASTFVNNVHHTKIPDARAMLGSNGPHFAGALIKDAAFAIRKIAERWVASQKPVGTYPTPGFGNGP